MISNYKEITNEKFIKEVRKILARELRRNFGRKDGEEVIKDIEEHFGVEVEYLVTLKGLTYKIDLKVKIRD